MSLFDEASLVLIPDGAKASKLYSVKPTDGSGDFTFSRSTTATRVNDSGLIESVATNVPRIDYSEGGCPSLLLEPQRTNLLTYSESIDDWFNFVPSGSNLTITPNDVNSIIEGELAERLVIDTSGGDIALRSQTFSATSGVDYSVSFWAKSNSTNYTIDLFRLSALNSSSADVFANNVVLTNEWQKFEYTVNRSFSVATSLGIILDSDGDISITAIQVEAGSYPTSYIPTNSAAVTRNADSCVLTGVADLIGDSEGTLYFEGDFKPESSNPRIAISDNTLNNRVEFGLNNNGNTQAVVIVGGVVQFNEFDVGILESGQNAKLAFAYESNRFKVYVNGTEVFSDLSGTTFSADTLTHLYFARGDGATPFYGDVKQLTVFPTALTDTQLENLTS
jgi:hypothetical protein